MLGFTQSTAPPPIEIYPESWFRDSSPATQAQRVEMLKAQDEALWRMPDQTTILDWLKRNQVWILVGSLGLFALAIFGRRR